MPYRCLIVDDEPIAIGIIRSFLEKLEDFEVVDTFEDPLKAFQALRQRPVDLLFLDIQMPELSGLDLLRSLQTPVDVILTTAHREFALEGYEFNVVDYLLKPISFNRFLQAIDKFLQRKGQSVLPASGTPDEKEADHLFVRSDRKSVRVDFDEILYIEGLKDYVRIVTLNDQLLTKSSIGQMAGRLPADQFIRVHRSYIVPLSRITAFTATDVEIGRKEIPVGRSFRKAFLERMEEGGA